MILLALFLSAQACSSGPPLELRKILQIRTPGGGGHGFAASLLEIYTAYHVVKGEPEIHYRSPYDASIKGAAEEKWSDATADVAKLTTYRTVPSLLEFAGKEPAIGETLWFAGFQFNQTAEPGDVFYSGLYMGRDEQGHMVVDSNGVEGFSGSPLLNAAGKVVGLMILYGHTTEVYEGFECDRSAARLSCDFQFLMQVARHRSMTFALPLWQKR